LTHYGFFLLLVQFDYTIKLYKTGFDNTVDGSKYRKDGRKKKSDALSVNNNLDPGSCQASCRINFVFQDTIFSGFVVSTGVSAFSGFNQTLSTIDQSLVSLDQRPGFINFADL